MTPFFFGRPERQLFGLFQSAQTSLPATAGVLLCNPFGQEAVRTHRMFRVLADRLNRAGIDVLRFDYFATGDSAGDDAEGEPTGWARDLCAAHEELSRRSRAARIIWIGARLGASLAIKATALATHPPERLILWEPIVDGPAYLRELAVRHIQTLETSYNFPNSPWRELLDLGSTVLEREGIGFELGESLRAQLGELRWESIAAPRASRCDIIEPREHSSVSEMIRRWRARGLSVNEVRLVHDFDWLAAEALDTALVPAEAVLLLSELVSGSK